MRTLSLILIIMTPLLQAATPSDTCRQETWVTDGPVNAIALAGDRVYIGGVFTHVAPYTGSWVPIDSSTCTPETTFPKINGIVYAMCEDGNGGWFIGGEFTAVDGVTRNNIAHVLFSGRLDTAWNPDANRLVVSLVMSGTTVYAGGDFDTIGGQSRSCIAALDATTGNVTAWNPNANRYVLTLAVSGTTVYAGGHFTSIGGQSRNYIAALDVTTGNATAWNPNADYDVLTLAVSGTTVYAGGWFTSIGGQSRSHIAALDATTGNATAWNPNANTRVFSLVVSGTTVYAGGEFTSIGGQSRNYIAALDATTGNATAWNPSANHYIFSIVVSGSTVYVGGAFSSIGQGIGHPYFAQFGEYNPNPIIQRDTSPSLKNKLDIQQITDLSSVKFAYTLPKPEHVLMRLYKLNGQLQSELVNRHQNAGDYTLSLQRDNIATGSYLLVFRAGEYHQERMILLVK